jgi:hypothetical protein
MPRGLRRFTTATTAATTVVGALLLGAPLLADQHEAPVAGVSNTAITLAATHSRVGRPWPGHPGRRLVPHTVRRGETATGLAVRYHAWTRELIRLNHLGSGALATGRHIQIPVVLSALPKKHRHHPPKKARKTHSHTSHHRTTHHPWRHDHADRRTVRHTVVRTAKRHEVDPELALAIAWQESGWQQHRISDAQAVGVMQVLPSSGRWMSMYVGRDLNVYGLHDNVTTGVVMIKVLRSQTTPKRAIGSYYQGLGSVRRQGMYHSTKHYVANVRALKKRLSNGWLP